MVLLLLSCLWMLLVPLSFGSWFLDQLRRWSKTYLSSNDTESVSVLVIWWLGIALLTALLETWALFGPLRGPTFLTVGLLSVGLPLLSRSGWQQVVGSLRLQFAHWSPLAWVTMVLVGLNLLVLGTLPPLDGDTAVYHAPFVRWLEEMGTVPGLANLDLHLGYNSSWFATEVLSSWGQWLGSPVQSLMPLTLILFTGYALAPLTRKQTGLLSYTALFRLLLGFVLLFWGSYGILSLGADSASIVLTFTILSQTAELGVPSRSQPLALGHLAVVLLILYAITIKLTVVPLVLIPLFWFWHYPRPGRIKVNLLIRMVSFGLILTLPWLLNTVTLTGYLFFPFPALDLLTVDWKVPATSVADHVSYIRNFARNPALTQYNVYGKPVSYWLPIWWQQQQPYDRFITLLLPGLALINLGIFIRCRTWQSQHRTKWSLLIGVTLLGIVFWFNSAPAYRFGYAFVLPLFCLLLIPLLAVCSRKLHLNLRPWLALSMVAALLATTTLIELRSFGVPRQLTPTEFSSLLAHLPAEDTRVMVAACYPIDSTGYYSLRAYLPGTTKLKLVYTLTRHGQLQANGLVATTQRWLLPAPYPVNTFEVFRVKQVKFLRPAAHPAHPEYGYWYAPFPATSTSPSSICLRSDQLREGFLPCQAASR
ncbi:LIC_10190 family membrane protein [Hymenobacter sp. GOD-10R]|uniref:LIC_10190 family membrane protein n=1 Tax=Hymenobacter sp. GOD-10R TaxID=3093922 RepID=UPI002D794882|nr:hypothetical protein [Hymenobacter sp. GOD-10R]WRQ26615.1 hypothetical protein SD425_16200 [Hymenobacter sp. GOD-10R]